TWRSRAGSPATGPAGTFLEPNSALAHCWGMGLCPEPTSRQGAGARGQDAINRPATITVPPSYLPQGEQRRARPRRAVASPMSIFAHPHAIAAAKPALRCTNCRTAEVLIADLQAWIDDLRQSRDHWRDLALGARDLALDAERAAADAALTLSKG